FALSRKQVLQLIRDLRNARFGAMPQAFGSEESGEGEAEEREKEKEREKEHRFEKVYLNGALSVRLGTDVKRVAQSAEGEQNAEFAKLVSKILSVSEKAAAKGVGAASFADGLARLADGKLAPETLQVLVQSRAKAPGATGGESWVLRI